MATKAVELCFLIEEKRVGKFYQLATPAHRVRANLKIFLKILFRQTGNIYSGKKKDYPRAVDRNRIKRQIKMLLLKPIKRSI